MAGIPCPGWFSAWLGQLLLRDLPANWRLSYLCFSIASVLVIGSLCMINPVSSTVFIHVVGADQHPLAKSLLPVVLLPVLFLYNILISFVRSARLIVLLICGAYGSVYLALAISIGIEGREDPWFGWMLFFVTETKGTVVNVVLWSAINDVSDPAYVKQAYPVLSFVTQLGAIAGSSCAVNVRFLGGTCGLLLAQAVALPLVIVAVWAACGFAARARELEATQDVIVTAELSTMSSAILKADEDVPTLEPKCKCCRKICQATGKQLSEFVEGIRLILTRPYVLMTFWVSCAHLAIVAIIDYQGQVLMKKRFLDDVEAQVAFYGQVMLVCGITTALLSCLGTRVIVERCGLRASLVALPVAMLCAITTITFYHSLWVICVMSVVCNTLSFGLNNPCREMLYVRASRDIKYRAKSWGDMYGAFLQKTVGAQINMHVNRDQLSCQPSCFNGPFSLAFSVAWISVWIAAALGVGRIHAKLEQDDEIIS